MSTSEVVALREFLQGFENTNGPRTIPRVLQRLARRAVGPRQPEHVVDDVVQDFLVKLVDATRRGSPGSATALLELDTDARLVAVVAHRLRQVAVQSYSRWPVLKALRGHVRAILREGIEPGAAMPTSLLNNTGRMVRGLVAQGVSALLTDGNERSVAGVSDGLMALFFDINHEHQNDLPEDAPSTEDLLVEHHDAHVHACRVERVLGRDAAQLVAKQCLGTTLETLAAERGTAVSTTHSHLQGPRRRLRQLCRRSCVSPRMHTRAMVLLAMRTRQRAF